ncbi:MFS transporter [Streptomyces sp. NPDC014846]|uniref:MFS transporter n=1 Tax=Streptomyces sp. NPDC014846 TaxID=3364922 RepID=UPI003701D90B
MWGAGDAKERAFDVRERLALLAAALASLVVELDWLAVNVAIPGIAHDLQRSPTDLQWLISAFTLAFGGVMPVAGWVVDAFGRRRTTVYALMLFIMGSLICAFADSLALLIAGRALQGLAGGFVVPGAVAMTVGGFTGRRRDVGLGVVMATASSAAALAPFVGGLLVHLFGWRSVFFMTVPVGLASVVLIYHFVVPSSNPMATARRPPVLNGACIMGGAVALTVAADRGSTWGWTSLATFLCVACGVWLLAGFVWLESRESSAMFSRNLYQDRRLHILTLSGATSVIGFVMLSTLAMWYLQAGRGLSALLTGSLLLCFSLPNAAATYAAGRLVARRSSHVLLSAALAAAAIGLVATTTVPFPGPYALALAVCGIGVGLSGGLTNILIQQRSSAEEAGAVASVTTAFKYLGAAVATALAATALETLHHSVGGSAADASGIDTVLRVTAVLPAAAVLLTAPAALACHRR